MRYTLKALYNNDFEDFNDAITHQVLSFPQSLLLGYTQAEDYQDVLDFICGAIWYYFYDDLVVYNEDTKLEVADTFVNRMAYDVVVKLPYWKRKKEEIEELLSQGSNLMQTSKVTSSSTDNTNSAGGTLQKTATTPTGVSTGSAIDEIDISIDEGGAEVETTGFADKYTNAQQKFANASRVIGSRSGTITREGSISELVDVLEKLPSSFADEITKALQKHFIFDYEGEERGIYNETI